MYKTAEGKGENKYGLDGSAARSKCLPWQWCLAQLLLCLLGAHLAAPGSLALPLGSAHPLGAQPLPGVLELLTYDPSTLLTLNYRPRRGRGARAQGGGAHAHLLGEHDGEGRQGHRRRRLRLRQARRVLDQALRAEGRAVEMRVARSCSWRPANERPDSMPRLAVRCAARLRARSEGRARAGRGGGGVELGGAWRSARGPQGAGRGLAAGGNATYF